METARGLGLAPNYFFFFLAFFFIWFLLELFLSCKLGPLHLEHYYQREQDALLKILWSLCFRVKKNYRCLS